MKRFLSFFISALCAVGAWAQHTQNGHEYVDLGLSVKWATCNVGANTPQSAGDYYSWGGKETLYEAGSDMENPTWKEGYSAGYDYSSYEYMDHSKDSYFGYTKYTIDDGQSDGVWYNSEGEFIGDGRNELEDVDDVAVQKWGGRWKMPTLEQQLELSYGCYWVWTNTYNGESVNGYIVYKAKKEEDQGVRVSEYGTPSSDYDVATDAHIFLPAAGYFKGAGLSDNGEFGRYWMRSLEFDGTFNAFCIGFSNYEVNRILTTERIYGCLVRPVYATPIAQIGETIYSGVDAFITAFEAIEGTATVQLLGDITLPKGESLGNKNENADITLDLNGHNITGYREDDAVILVEGNKLTIVGDGTVENPAEFGDVVGGKSAIVINGGTYIGEADAVYIYRGGELIINGGKFEAPYLYDVDDSYTMPIVKGGLFSMDPTDCLAVGYDVVENIDEESKDVYPYMVVKSDVELKNLAGLLAVPQAGELNIRAYFTAPMGKSLPYMYMVARGGYKNLNEAISSLGEEDVVSFSKRPLPITMDLQPLNIKDSFEELVDGETYTLFVYLPTPTEDEEEDEEEEYFIEFATIAFTVGEGEIYPGTIPVEAGKLDIKASLSVSDEELEAGVKYSYALFEGRITNMMQMVMVEMSDTKTVLILDKPVAIESNDVEIILSSDDVELEAGKDYTLIIIDPTRLDPALMGYAPVVYDFIIYKAVEKNTETAIERVNADKAQKAIKTIENGRVVIIRGDKKYDLSGREL
ncbi:MAG: hypothetical protein MJZ31_06335 [Bacteroidales bacterium]|nr:hypothetical protein [Bacteroidales bacterium]